MGELDWLRDKEWLYAVTYNAEINAVLEAADILMGPDNIGQFVSRSKDWRDPKCVMATFNGDALIALAEALDALKAKIREVRGE